MRTTLPRPNETIQTSPRNNNNNSNNIGAGTRAIYLNCYPYYLSGTLPSPLSSSTAAANANLKLTTSPFDNNQEPQYSLSPSSLDEKNKHDDLTDKEEQDGDDNIDSDLSSLLVKSSSLSSRKNRVSILTSQTPTLSSSSSTLSSSSSANGYNAYHNAYPVASSPTTATTAPVTTACWEFNFSFLPRLPFIKLKNVMHGLKRVASSSHHANKDNDNNIYGIKNQSSISSSEELSTTIVAHCADHDNVEMFTPETVERETHTTTTTTTSTSSTTPTLCTANDIVYQRSRLLQQENEDYGVSIEENKHHRHYRISWKNNLCEYNDGSVWEQEQERRKKNQHRQQTTTTESVVAYYKFVAKDYTLRENPQQQPLTTLPPSSSSSSSLTSPMNHHRHHHAHRRVSLISQHRRHHRRHNGHGRRSHQRRRNKDPQWRAAQVEKANETWRMNVRGNV